MKTREAGRIVSVAVIVAVGVNTDGQREVLGLKVSERQALRLVGMSASTLRYRPRDDGNGRLRERLTELAGQHRRHGYRMLHSRLRIDGWALDRSATKPGGSAERRVEPEPALHAA